MAYFKPVPTPPVREEVTASGLIRRVQEAAGTDSYCVDNAIMAFIATEGASTVIYARGGVIAGMFRTLADIIENEVEA